MMFVFVCFSGPTHSTLVLENMTFFSVQFRKGEIISWAPWVMSKPLVGSKTVALKFCLPSMRLQHGYFLVIIYITIFPGISICPYIHLYNHPNKLCVIKKCCYKKLSHMLQWWRKSARWSPQAASGISYFKKI